MSRIAANVAAETVDPGSGSDDSREFERWYTLYHDRLHGWCRRTLRDDAAAEDVVQETLLRAWKHRDRFTEEAQIAPWLWRVARNLCVDVVRSRRRLSLLGEFPDAADPDADPTRGLAVQEDQVAVRRALRTLSARHVEVLLARDVNDEPYESLAVRHGVTLEGARALLFRARRSLREAIATAGGLGLVGGPALFGRKAIAWIREHVPSLTSRPALGLEVAAVVAAFAFVADPGPTAPLPVSPPAAETLAVDPDAGADQHTADGALDGQATLDALSSSLVPPDGADLDGITEPVWRARLAIGGRQGDSDTGLLSVDLQVDGEEDGGAVLLSEVPSVEAGILQRPPEPDTDQAAEASDSTTRSKPQLIRVDLAP